MNILDSAIDLNKSFQKVMPLAAIWLNKVMETSKGITARIEPGDEIRIEYKAICDISKDCPATHKVKDCLGNISNTVLYFELLDLKTNELLILNI